jgi:hypothetical protein
VQEKEVEFIRMKYERSDRFGNDEGEYYVATVNEI